MSKAITAMLVMALIEEGILDLDGTLAEIIPPELVPESWRTVSIRQLLSHTSGFPADRTRWFDGSYSTCFEAYQRSVTRSAPVDPGSYDYSNTNFCTLSLMTIFATGVSYEEAAYRYVFRPLGIGRRTMDDEYGNLAGAGGWRLSALDT
ncbi:MAG: serine hydrolase domain-containing protein, partial [Actinomycetota bacterium]